MTAINSLIVLTYLAGILFFSVVLHRRRPCGDPFLAGRAMGWFPVGLSVMITLFSAVNFVAFPTEVMEHGLYVLASLPVFVLVAIPVTRVFIPFFHAMRLTSVYEYLEHRFDRRTRLLAAGLFIFWRLCWMATALYASARILGIVTGFPYPLLLIVAGVVAALYTALGGIRTVMWTDVVQFMILLVGLGGAVWFAIRAGVGSEGCFWVSLRDGGHLRPFAPPDSSFFSWDPTIRITLWSGLVGTFVAFLTRYTADQMVVQRYFTARDVGSAVRGFWLNVLVALGALLLLTFLGLAIANRPGDPAAPALVRFGAFAASLPFGLTGILAAGLLAATMSSVDSGLNSCLASWMTDFESRPAGKATDWRQESRYRVLVALLTLATLALAFGVGRTGDLFAIVNRVINGVGSPLLALIVLGMFSRSTTARGAWVGGGIGIVASVAISFGWEGLALHYYAVVNFLVTVLMCRIISLLDGHRNKVTDAQLAWTWSAGTQSVPRME